MDNIIAKKIWEDTYGFELEIRFVSRFVDVHSKIYVSAPMLLKNKDIFSEFLSNNNRCKLCLGEIGGIFAPGVELNICKNRTGHILIDVILELNDDASPKHEILRQN